jgi:hypothetical protein
VYRDLILAVCRPYHQLLPNLFEELDDASELMLPDDLLSNGSIAGDFRSQISDSDCEDMEMIGWCSSPMGQQHGGRRPSWAV